MKAIAIAIIWIACGLICFALKEASDQYDYEHEWTLICPSNDRANLYFVLGGPLALPEALFLTDGQLRLQWRLDRTQMPGCHPDANGNYE